MQTRADIFTNLMWKLKLSGHIGRAQPEWKRINIVKEIFKNSIANKGKINYKKKSKYQLDNLADRFVGGFMHYT